MPTGRHAMGANHGEVERGERLRVRGHADPLEDAHARVEPVDLVAALQDPVHDRPGRRHPRGRLRGERCRLVRAGDRDDVVDREIRTCEDDRHVRNPFGALAEPARG